MNNEIVAPWDNAAIEEYTDLDLESSRDYNTAAYDSEGDLRRAAETLRQSETLDNLSGTLDRALRVELAWLIDEEKVNFSRDDFNVAYLIPPKGWVSEQTFQYQKLVDESEVGNDARIHFSTPHIVWDMLQEAIEVNEYETITEAVTSGVFRMLGHLSINTYTDLPFVELFRTATRRQLIKFAIEGMERDREYAKWEILDNVEIGDESVRKEMPNLIKFGVFVNTTGDKANIPHYKVAESDVISILSSWNAASWYELFGTKGCQKILVFFFTVADESHPYSMNQIHKEFDISYTTVSENIDTIADTDLVKAREGKQATRYQADRDTEIYDDLLRLNNVLCDTFNELANKD